MGRSLALSLYLLLAERGGPAPTDVRSERPDGPLLWVVAGEGSRAESLKQVVRLVRAERPGLTILVTHPTGGTAMAEPATAGVVTDALPGDRLPLIRAFLDHWRPGAALFIGGTLPPALIAESRARGIRLLLADVRLAAGDAPLWRRGLVGSVLQCFSRVLTQDPDTARLAQRLGGKALSVELGGRIEETTEPLPCQKAELEALIQILRARPVWLAVACPESEEDAVIAAHAHAMQYAHRLLLIVAPADAARAPALADKSAQAGLTAALRSQDEDPTPDVQVLIADGQTELGLWYRLAPVAFMGGTLVTGGTGRSPAEPAALGSAIVHGLHPGPYPDAYMRLTEARATRIVSTPADLAAAVADLIAADKAAVLAHNAWAATSGGAEVAERVVQIALSLMADEAAGKEAA